MRRLRRLSTSWGIGLSDGLSASSMWARGRELIAWGREPRVRRVLVSGGTSPPTWTNERVEIGSVINSRLGGEDLGTTCRVREQEGVELVVPRELEQYLALKSNKSNKTR